MAMFDDVDKKLSGWFNAGAEKAKGMSETLRLSNAIREEETKQPSCIGRWENIFMIILQLQRKEK